MFPKLWCAFCPDGAQYYLNVIKKDKNIVNMRGAHFNELTHVKANTAVHSFLK